MDRAASAEVMFQEQQTAGGGGLEVQEVMRMSLISRTETETQGSCIGG